MRDSREIERRKREEMERARFWREQKQRQEEEARRQFYEITLEPAIKALNSRSRGKWV